jgi:hypothetical protein
LTGTIYRVQGTMRGDTSEDTTNLASLQTCSCALGVSHHKHTSHKSQLTENN